MIVRSDLLAHPVQVGLRPGQDSVRVRGRAQGEGEFAGKPQRPDPGVREIAVTVGEPCRQPGAVPRQRLERGGAHPGELRGRFGCGLERHVDLVADQRDRAVELPGIQCVLTC